MGGEGSGRPPSVETLIARSQPVLTPVGNDLFLPNYSGVQNTALKTSPNQWQVAGNNLYYNAGNVGIGTTSPTFSLDIKKPTANLILNSSTGTTYSYLGFTNTGGDMFIGRDQSTGGGLATGSSAYAGVINAQGTYPLQLAVNNAIGITMLNGGKVGIGTTSPSTILSLAGQSAQTIGMENYVGNGNGNTLTIKAGGGTVGGTNNNGGNLNISAGASTGAGISKISFLTAGGGSIGTTATIPTERMTILGNGNVGIGTTNPSDKLNISLAGAGITGGITISDSYQFARLYDSTGGEDTGTLDLSYNGVLKTRILANGNSYFNGGNVGIGTTTPNYPLHVSGSICASGATAVFNIRGTNGVDGTFTTVDLKTVTVSGGIIISIV